MYFKKKKKRNSPNQETTGEVARQIANSEKASRYLFKFRLQNERKRE